MNSNDVFRKLTRGLSFNRKKFREDAEALGIVDKKGVGEQEEKTEVNAKDGIFISRNDNLADDPVNSRIISDFDEVVNPRLVKNVADCLGWSKPTRIQMAAIDLVRSGFNLVATAQTGSGKTGAFMIPLVQMCMDNCSRMNKPFGLVLAPSRELAEQIASVGRAIAKNTNVSVAGNIFYII